MALWVVKAGRHGEHEQFAVENSVAVIGWDDLGDLSKVSTRDDLKTIMERTYPNDKTRKISINTGQTWSFSHKIKEGDLIALPLKTSPAVAVGRVTGGYQFDSSAAAGRKNQIPVHWIREDVPRTKFDQDILYGFGAQMTVCRVRAENAEARVNAILEDGNGSEDDGGDGPNAVDLESFAKDQIRQQIGQNLKGHVFADLVADILKAQGYKLFVSPPGPDGGVDILAGSGPLGLDAPQIAVQVKSSDSPLGTGVVRNFLGVMQQFKANLGLIVCWGGFKESAKKEARQQFFTLRLWDSEDVISAIQEHYEKLSDSIKADLPLKRIWALVSPQQE